LGVLLGTQLTRVNRLTGDVYSPRIDECWLNSWRAEEQVEPTRYQICVHGRLSERLAAALEGMTLLSGPVNTVFTGEVKDQSQLYGLLDRLRDLGLELISVQPQPEGASEYLAAPDFGEGISRPTEIGGVPTLSRATKSSVSRRGSQQ
jgi:hypothetical protein